MSADTRVLFTDLDGTLLNDAKEVTPGNQTAIDEALAKAYAAVDKISFEGMHFRHDIGKTK